MATTRTCRVRIGMFVLVLLVTAVPGNAVVRMWDNGGAGTVWSTTGNWDPDGYADSDDLIVLSGGPTSTTVFVDNGGSITLDGSAAVASFSSSLYIAYSTDASGRLDVLNGADVSSTSGYLGYNSGASGTATVSGTGSTWTNSSSIYVGRNGTGSLSITDGGTVSNTIGRIGYDAGSSGEVMVSGVGSSWTNSSLYVGRYGTGSLSINNGAAVSNMYGYLGYEDGSSGAVTVSGAGSIWTNSGQLYVGYNYSGEVGTSSTASLEITNGAAVSDTYGSIGRHAGSSGVVTISGAGSTWTNSSSLYVGYEGTGVMSITNGAAVSNTSGYIGRYAGSSGEVTLSGAGSIWTNSSDLYIGYYGMGTLTISTGGTVHTNSMRVAYRAGSTGTVNLEGGSLTADSIAVPVGTGTFNWTGGTLAVTGSGGLTLSTTGLLGSNINIYAAKGLDVTATTTINSDVTLAVTGGAFSTGALVVSGTAQLRSGVITIVDTFTINNGGELDIAGQDLALMTAPTLNTGSELILEGTTVNAPSLTLPSGASIDLDSGKISAAGTFSNSGVIRMGNTGAATIRANLLTNDGVLMGKGTIQAVVTNNSNMGFSGDVFFTEDAQNNPGSLIAISGGAGATFYGDVTNNGELRVGAGCTATFYGSFSGSGTTGTGMVYMDGDMMPGASPGEMSFGGDVVFGMAASLEAELAGTGIGQFDSIDVAGDLVLAGTLDVMLYGGFNPVDGDTFDILDWGTLSGTFGMVNLPGLTEGLGWDESSLYTTGEISVMSELVLLAGDANRDGQVSAGDYASVQANFGNTGAPNDPTLFGDANLDGIVSAGDYASVQANFGNTAAMAVPEPMTMSILAIGGLALLRRKRN